MTFPIAYEVSPLALRDYLQIKLHLGANLTKGQATFFANSNFGAAFGALGATY